MMATEYIWSHGRRIEMEILPSHVTPKRRRADQYIGCPLEWLKRILPLVKSPEQLAVAIWLHRRRAVCRNEVFTVPNQELHAELDIGRLVKYRTLKRLEKVGAIALIRTGKRVLQVQILR
jgi:hypothetical protein